MTSISLNNPAHTPDPVKEKKLFEYYALVKAIPFTPADAATAADIVRSGAGSREVQITSAVAAAIFVNHNRRLNRDFSISRAEGYREAMKTGRWYKANDAIAFYPTGDLGNGQHRMGALALSGLDQPLTFIVMCDFEDAAVRVIDRQTRRTVGDTMAMAGIEDAKLKASCAKAVLNYTKQFDDPESDEVKVSEAEIEAFVADNGTLCNRAVEIGAGSLKNVSEPSTNAKNATAIAMLMLAGGWSDAYVRAFMASVQTGQAQSEASSTLIFSRLLMKAKHSEKKDALRNQHTMLAHAMKAADLWVRDMRCNSLKWNKEREALPDYHIPAVATPTAQAAD